MPTLISIKVWFINLKPKRETENDTAEPKLQRRAVSIDTMDSVIRQMVQLPYIWNFNEEAETGLNILGYHTYYDNNCPTCVQLDDVI